MEFYGHYKYGFSEYQGRNIKKFDLSIPNNVSRQIESISSGSRHTC